ncbi:MAG: iron donor protein CyaY [Candidatus Dactylopiibacterium sp.]|nr:iron donor protein CyaY [Candidatus Dactylopiibacterium sp.]
MEEAAFLELADAMLVRIESLVERAVEATDLDVDLEPQAGGILKLEFADGSQIIINRHAAAKEIWVAARSGGFHYRPEGGQWLGTRDGRELLGQLEELIGQQAGRPVLLQD